MENNHYPFINLPLPYAYDALEPFIDEKTTYLHHDKHLQTYIDNLNAVLESEPKLQKMSLEQLIKNVGSLPKRVQTPIQNNAGGVYNHRFFFEGIAAPSAILQEAPDSWLGVQIERQFGSFENFRSAFKKAALSVFGSGYAWLVCDGCRLKIITTANQHSPIEQGYFPILTIDVWEHAYYLKHYNVRVSYIDDWFKVVNWQQAQQNYLKCSFLRHKISKV